MKDKRTHIIETAIRLFAEKGFYAASIQEIADAAGIAKGSMYLYFKSKDDLLLSIYSYYERVFNEIYNAGHEGMNPREKTTLQLKGQLEKFEEFRDFIKMQMREQYIHKNEELKQAAMQMKVRGMVWLYEQIVALYGERIRPWAMDCTHMMHGIIGGYMGAMVIRQTKFDMQELAEFLMDRLDDLAEGMMRRESKPMLHEAEWAEFLKSHSLRCGPVESALQSLLRQLREAVEELPGEPEASDDFTASLQVLEEELQKEKPTRVIVQGMLTYLLQGAPPNLKKLLKQLQVEVAAELEQTKK